MGHSVLSTWLEEQIKPEGMTDSQFGKKMAAKDLQEIRAADCIILDLENPSKTMGKMVEYGFALAHHKLAYVVGIPTTGHIFISLSDGVFKDWDELFVHFEINHPTMLTGVNTPKPGEWIPVTEKQLKEITKRK